MVGTVRPHAWQGAQRRRQRPRRWLTRVRFVGKCCVGLVLCAAVAWGGYIGYQRLCTAEYFRLRTVRMVGSQVLTEPDVRYLLGLSADITLLQLDLPRLGA